MSELTNLLPHDRVRTLSREYYLRLGTVVLVLLSLLVLIHAILLAPTYIYLSEEVKTRQAHLDGLSSTLASSEEQVVHDRLVSLTGNAERLLTLTSTPRASAPLRKILEVPSEGVRLTGMSITPPSSGEGQMRIMGIATTRESLRRYREALAALPFVSKADLPLSVYAEERDITFSIALTGTLTP